MTIAELFATRKQWIRGHYAACERSGRANPGAALQRTIFSTTPDSEHATCWCLSGAVRRCYPLAAQQKRVLCKLREAIETLGWRRAFPTSMTSKYETDEGIVVRFNDSPETSFRQVKAVVDLAKV
jgi:hypothetical protein